jgi:hypothetical protein
MHLEEINLTVQKHYSNFQKSYYEFLQAAFDHVICLIFNK